MNEQFNKIAEYVYDGEKNRHEIIKVTKKFDREISKEEAYKLQELVLCLREKDGLKRLAPKMGLTSKAKWNQMGVDSPIFGYIFEDMLEKNNTIQFDQYIHPKIEPEIAIVLKKEIGGDKLTIEEVKENIDYVLSAVEVIDSRYQNFDFTFIDVIIDNTSAKGAILGSKRFSIDNINLLQEKAEIYLNGEKINEGLGTAVLGNPINAIIELAKHLNKYGKKIQPGLPLLTGGLTSAVMIQKGDKVEVKYSKLEDLVISVE